MTRTSLGLFAAAVLCTPALAQTSPQLPTDPASWINAPPLSNEMLKGKAAVFIFYEEN